MVKYLFFEVCLLSCAKEKKKVQDSKHANYGKNNGSVALL